MRTSRVLLVPFTVLLFVICSLAEGPAISTDEVIARHLDSIAPAAKRAGIKSRTAQANARLDVVTGPAVHSEGSAMLVSMGRQLSIAIRMPDGMAPDEQFLFDGKEPRVALIGPGTRSPLGDWLYREDSLLRESIFGGTLLTSWALTDVRGRGAKVKYEGLKKVDGRDLHDLTYYPKKGADNDLLIHVYLEPETFRHVKTVYTFKVQKGLVHLAEQQRGAVRSSAADRFDTKYRVEETFSEFRTVDGVTLPGHWKLQYTTDSDRTISTVWDFSIGALAHNNVVD